MGPEKERTTTMATVWVEVAVRDDRRLVDAVASLAAQQRRPERILIAASPMTPESLLREATGQSGGVPVTIRKYAGGVVDARASSLPDLEGEVTVFLDADERAPPEWLGNLVAPIEAGRAAFSGGPTRPVRPPEGAIERYAVLLEASIYADLVPRRITYLPLQNTAWRTEALRALGFDPRIPFAEDHDLESRAARAGLAGEFVPDAWVYHDQTEYVSFARWARKRYRYLVAMGMSLMKNGELGARLAERRVPVRHPLRWVESAMKPFAFVSASIRWHRVAQRPTRGATG